MDKRMRERFDQRYKLLRRIYDELDGESGGTLDYDQLNRFADELRMSYDDMENAFSWLCEEGLTERLTSESFELTHVGVKDIEKAARHPEQGTQFFPSQVTNNVTNIYGGSVGAIQAGSHNTANVVQQFRDPELGNVLSHLAELRAAAESLPDKTRNDAVELVDALEEQAKADKPKAALARSCGDGLKPYLIAYAPVIATVVDYIVAKVG